MCAAQIYYPSKPIFMQCDMQLHKGYPKAKEQAVVVIGNFDGVYLGHQALIGLAREKAHSAGLSLAVLTFAPHPRRFFAPDSNPFLLGNPAQKNEWLAALGVNDLYILDFDKALAQMSAQDFIDQILVAGLKAHTVMVGDDFTFGHKRSGNVDLLHQAQDRGLFKVQIARKITADDGGVYSSTRVREDVSSGEFYSAQKLLGRPFTVRAPVIAGDQRGRTLGYPTANQRIDDYVQMPYGVYAVRARVEGLRDWHYGVANFGIRPMFEVATPLLETYIFDFARDIYGKNLDIEPVQKLRPEMKFKDIAALVTQIEQDCVAAMAVLKSL